MCVVASFCEIKLLLILFHYCKLAAVGVATWYRAASTTTESTGGNGMVLNQIVTTNCKYVSGLCALWHFL